MKLVREHLNEERKFPVLTPGWSDLSPDNAGYFSDVLQSYINKQGDIGQYRLQSVEQIFNKAGMNGKQIMQQDDKYDLARKLISAVNKEGAYSKRRRKEYDRDEKHQVNAQKSLATNDNISYSREADEDILKKVLNQYNLWKYVTPENYIRIYATTAKNTSYSGSVESTKVVASGNIEITSPRGSNKPVNIDQDFENIYVSSYGYDHHYYDY